MANVASWLYCLWMGKHWAGMVAIMRPLFDVGEEVILVSKLDPNLSGPAVVIEVMKATWCHQNCMSKFAYMLNIEAELYHGWCQCSLRKKPEPGGDFESFMDELKQPIKQPVMVEK